MCLLIYTTYRAQLFSTELVLMRCEIRYIINTIANDMNVWFKSLCHSSQTVQEPHGAYMFVFE